MANELRGRRIAFMIANEGVEQVELTEPWQAVKDAGGSPELLAPEGGQAQAFNHLDKAGLLRASSPRPSRSTARAEEARAASVVSLRSARSGPA